MPDRHPQSTRICSYAGHSDFLSSLSLSVVFICRTCLNVIWLWSGVIRGEVRAHEPLTGWCIDHGVGICTVSRGFVVDLNPMVGSVIIPPLGLWARITPLGWWYGLTLLPTHKLFLSCRALCTKHSLLSPDHSRQMTSKLAWKLKTTFRLHDERKAANGVKWLCTHCSTWITYFKWPVGHLATM